MAKSVSSCTQWEPPLRLAEGQVSVATGYILSESRENGVGFVVLTCCADGKARRLTCALPPHSMAYVLSDVSLDFNYIC